MYKQFPYKATFNSPHEQYAELNGQTLNIIGIISEPQEGWDMEALPALIAETKTGEIINVFEEEVECELTTSVIRQWCYNHIDVVAQREGLTVEEMKEKLDYEFGVD